MVSRFLNLRINELFSQIFLRGLQNQQIQRIFLWYFDFNQRLFILRKKFRRLIPKYVDSKFMKTCNKLVRSLNFILSNAHVSTGAQEASLSWVGKQYYGGHNLPPLADIGSTDLPKPGWAIAHSAHPSPTPLFYRSILIFRISLILCEF